ncbi:MAG: hypothetical protein EOO36_14760, partial [Cytophagaceae bacterium]
MAFSENVTGFVASDVAVANGTLSGFAGSGSGPYSFSVTPTGNVTVTVGVPAGVAQDGAGNNNTAASPFSITYRQPVTATPVVTAPANGSLLNIRTPTYQGTAPTGSTVAVYVDGASAGTTTASGGSFAWTPTTSLSDGSHTVYATAQTSGAAVSANSTTNTFSVDATAPTVVISSSAGASGSSTSTSPLTFTTTFSEGVTGFSANGLAVTNGTVTSGSLSGSGTTYTFTVTPTTAGTATVVAVSANAAQDAAGNGSVASSSFRLTCVAPITSTTWTGASSSDWFTASNWTNGVPTATIDAVINPVAGVAPLLASGSAAARNLTLGAGYSLTHNGGTLTVKGDFTTSGLYNATSASAQLLLNGSSSQAIGGSAPTLVSNLTVGAAGVTLAGAVSVQRVLTLTGNLTTNGQPLTLLSNASTGDALVDNTDGGEVIGEATVQRYIDPSLNSALGYRQYSAPIRNATVASFTTNGFTPVINPAYNTSATPTAELPFPTVYGYDESRVLLGNSMTDFEKGYYSPAALSDALTVGRGYTVNIGANQTVSFVGTLNNKDYTVNLTSNRATNANAGWQLVGNPYPSPLDYSIIADADLSQLEAAIYIHSSTSQYAGQYRSYVNKVGGNPIIAAGQGFFVRVLA